MNTYGHVIKFERIRQNIKQVQLAEDICTPSYLSKIESNSIVPSEEVRGKLFRRLKINSTPSAMSEEDYLKHVRLIYFEAVMYKDRQKTALILNEIENEYYLFQNSSNFYTYQMMILRLNLIVFKLQNQAEEIMMSISEMTKDFNDYQKFIYKLNLGFIYFFKQDYSHSLDSLETALGGTNQFKCEEWEIADLEYAIGLVFLFLHRNVSTILFTKKAILYFEKEFYYKRAIESYIVLGIVYRRVEKYKEAFEILQLAKKISVELNIKDNSPHIFYNLGTISAEQGELEIAIVNYKEALTLRNDNSGKIACMYAIMLAYSKSNDKTSVVSWCKKGIELCMNKHDDSLEINIHHFHCYLARFSNSENFEETFNAAISYFEKKEGYRYAHKYTLLLAQFYLDKKKYKKATTYFSLANDYLAKKENRKFIEDI